MASTLPNSSSACCDPCCDAQVIDIVASSVSGIYTVSTTAAVRAVPEALQTSTQAVLKQGATSAFDGGSEIYVWDAASTATDDGVFVIRPLTVGIAAAGRWRRAMPVGPWNVKLWGAKGDDVTDDSVAIQTALNALSGLGGGVLFFPRGTYLFATAITLPVSGNKIALRGERRADSRLHYMGAASPAISASVAGTEAGAYEFFDIAITGTGNANPLTVLSITNESSRNLTLEKVEIHNFNQGLGLALDGMHTVKLFDVLIHYCLRAADFGAAGNPAVHYFNAADLIKLSVENCSATDWVVRFQNALGVNWLGGTIEANESGVLVLDSEMFTFRGTYHEDNGVLKPYIELDRIKGGVVENNFFNGAAAGAGDIAIRLGSNSYASQGGGFLVQGNHFWQFREFTIEIGGSYSGLGPRYPVVANNSYYDCNQTTGFPFLWTLPLEAGELLEIHTGILRKWSAAGVQLWNIGASINSIDNLVGDFSGVTFGGISLPHTTTANLAAWTVPESTMAWDDTLSRPSFRVSGGANHVAVLQDDPNVQFTLVPNGIKYNFESAGGTLTGLRADITANGSAMILAKARGTLAAPAIIQNADVVGELIFRGYDGATYRDAGLIRCSINAAPGVNDMPGKMQLLTRADGNPTTDVVLELDNSVAADDTRMLLFDVNSSTLKRVSVGAVDSGGVGFRVLRIPN